MTRAAPAPHARSRRRSCSPASPAPTGRRCAARSGPASRSRSRDASGAPVRQLDPGTYALTVDDKSEEHNFHLQGPGGVDVSTEVEAIGVKTFSLTLVDGKYTFLCDPHPTQMTGTFTVGTRPGHAAAATGQAAPSAASSLTVTGKAVSPRHAGRQAGQGASRPGRP